MSEHRHAKDKLVVLGTRRPPVPAYWKSTDELENGIAEHGEFPLGLPPVTADFTPPTGEVEAAEHDDPHDHDDDDGPNRRDFLTIMGFSVGAASLAACRAPEMKAVPLPVAVEDMVAGVPNFYATTCGGCASACTLLVKQRDGRPIKIEGNDASEVFGGGTCASGQATVLGLYDNERLKGPLWQGKSAAWAEIDEEVTTGLRLAAAKQGKIALLTSSIHSPSLRALIDRFLKAYPTARHVTYDAISASALRAASAQAFGRALIPHYAFDKARVIVSLDADFLGTWISPVEFARAYARGRRLDGPEGLHVQFEPGMSVTGSNADQRVPTLPSQLGAVASALLARIAKQAGESADAGPDPVDGKILDEVAKQLWAHKGESLVVSGANDVAVQLVVHALNRMLGNLGKTVDINRPSQQRLGDDAEMATLVEDMNKGEIAALIMHGVNPGYDYIDGPGFVKALAKVPLAVSTTDRRDETNAAIQAVVPDHHFLESWGDAEPLAGYLTLQQPTIAPLYETRSFAETLLRWMDDKTDHYAYLREFWRTQVMPRQTGLTTFDAFWDHSLERGIVDLGAPTSPAADAGGGDWKAAVAATRDDAQKAGGDKFELAVFESVGLRDGADGNNPWLLEMPDPISKVSWGNVAEIAPQTAKKLGVSDGDIISLASGGTTIEAPVFIQPGQHPRSISLATGYGRSSVGKAGNGVGVNAFPMTRLVRGARHGWMSDVTVTVTNRSEKLASSQTHFSLEGRPIALETTREELKKAEKHEALPNLWPERLKGDKLWGMSIDLDACTGCSACVIACQAENNVPVVGKDQVQRQRIMHWMRIDRYYTGADENPQSIHQPMMCQHCNHAPCETVCPVLATTTSYTSGNHNDYNMANPTGRLVLNPDVTVRSRGVMEKCSLCVQRIAAVKNAVVKRGEPMQDGEVKTACQQVCPTDAIRFGDHNDPQSGLAQRVNGERTFRVLDDLGTRPNIAYLKKVRHGQAT
jgi:molybdopterin-containing oxidoreductase family iron-sulfur binding subunit